MKKIQNKVGETEQLIAQQCCSENLRKEVEATKKTGTIPHKNGRVPIACSGDTGWQGGGSRMTFNSQSGQTTMCGGLTKKVVAFKYFSKLCRTCHDNNKKYPEGNHLPPTHRCAKNWTESSKSMEPEGILDCVKQVWNSGIAWIDTFVSDDDSTSRAVIKHKPDNKLKSTGRLPDHIHKVTRILVDPSHRRRVYGTQLYKAEKHIKGMNKTDCECLMRNFGYAVKQNRSKSEEEFAKALKAAFDHHFDMHGNCNPSWCNFRMDSRRKSPDSIRSKFRSLKNPINKKIYDELKVIHDNYTSRENLLMMMHPFDSQKNEALNRAFTKHSPKNIVFSKTYSLFDRHSLVVIIDSVGYELAMKRIFAMLFPLSTCNTDAVTIQWAKREDKFKLYNLLRQRTKIQKIRRTASKKIRLMQLRLHNSLAKKKGDDYGHGIAIAAPQQSKRKRNAKRSVVTANVGERKQRRVPTQCKCTRTDHLRISFNNCPLNPKNIAIRLAAEAAANRNESVSVQPTNNEL